MNLLGALLLLALLALAIDLGYVVQRLGVGDLRKSPQFHVCMVAVFMSLLSVEAIARGVIPEEYSRFPYALVIPIAIGYLLGRARTARQKRHEDEKHTAERTPQTTSGRIDDDGAPR